MKSMQYLKVLCCILLVVGLAAVPVSFGQQLDVLYSSEGNAEQAGEDDNWNSHIDNQAYLEDFQTRQRTIGQAPIIILDSRGRGRCRYRNCDSWGVTYRTDGSSFSYYENYRPNRYHPIYIYKPERPTPYIRRENNQRVWGTEGQP